MTEREIALMEAGLANSMENYFEARPVFLSERTQKTFEAGYERGFKECLDVQARSTTRQ